MASSSRKIPYPMLDLHLGIKRGASLSVIVTFTNGGQPISNLPQWTAWALFQREPGVANTDDVLLTSEPDGGITLYIDEDDSDKSKIKMELTPEQTEAMQLATYHYDCRAVPPSSTTECYYPYGGAATVTDRVTPAQ